MGGQVPAPAGGTKIAAIISMEDLILLERMRRRREQIRAEPMPSDPAKVGIAMARSIERELFG